MNDAGAQEHQHIGNHSPMTAPPEDLSAHDRGPETPGQHQELEEASGKLITVQVVRVALKGWVPPGTARRLRRRLAAASQGGNGYVVDSGGMKRGGEHRLVVLRLAARTGKRRTSATASIPYGARMARNSGSERVECPTVHTVKVMPRNVVQVIRTSRADGPCELSASRDLPPCDLWQRCQKRRAPPSGTHRWGTGAGVRPAVEDDSKRPHRSFPASQTSRPPPIASMYPPSRCWSFSA